jgi:hypothetical protein
LQLRGSVIVSPTALPTVPVCPSPIRRREDASIMVPRIRCTDYLKKLHQTGFFTRSARENTRPLGENWGGGRALGWNMGQEAMDKTNKILCIGIPEPLKRCYTRKQSFLYLYECPKPINKMYTPFPSSFSPIASPSRKEQHLQARHMLRTCSMRRPSKLR